MLSEEDIQKLRSKTLRDPNRRYKRELGFGDKVTNESRLRLLNQDGSFNVRRRGFPIFEAFHFYHILLTMKWRTFMFLTLLVYFFSNIAFGFLYSSLGEDILIDSSAHPIKSIYLRGFFFSVQTFATIGYGTISPVGTVANLFVTLESYYSLLANALITGAVFARIAHPTAKVSFSQQAVVAPYENGSALMFRLINNRASQMIDVEATVMYARFVTGDQGIRKREIDTLELEREQISFMPLSWTVVHPINDESPLKGISLKEFEESGGEILILLKGFDETYAQIVHARTSYVAADVRFGYKFVSIYRQQPTSDGNISIDIRRLSQIEKVSF